ncbi:MAG: hypothetical protein R3F24_08345 [Gammaproteobacteria bacterium]
MRTITGFLSLALLCSTASVAADSPANGSMAGKSKVPPTPEVFAAHTGYEGRQDALTAALARAMRDAAPNSGNAVEFTPEQQRLLGVAMLKAIRTISDSSPYQHETNDALVKAHLTTVQFGKDNGTLDEMIDHEVQTQMPMLMRVGKMIRDGGSPELATIALTERTACFYQLVQEYQRDGTTMRWKSPYGNVLAITRKLGQHDLTERDVFEIYTRPLMQKQAKVMGMKADFAPWQADGRIAMTLRPM